MEVLGNGASLWMAGELLEGGKEPSGPESTGSLVGMVGGRDGVVGGAVDGSGGESMVDGSKSIWLSGSGRLDVCGCAMWAYLPSGWLDAGWVVARLRA